MSLDVRARADAIATFRFISIACMETLARWVPTTPELEVKVLFGRHLWDFAQHADAFGKRTGELRLGPQVSRAPTAAFRGVLERAAAVTETEQRVDGFYAGLMPAVEALYRAYLAETDALLDEPSIRILGHVLADFARLVAERHELARERPELKAARGSEGRAAPAPKLADVVDFRPAVPAGADAK